MTSLTRSFPLLINLYQQLARQTSALVHGRTVQPAAALPITPVAGSSASSVHLLITPPLGPNAVTQMQVIGALDRHSYQAFIASAAALYRQGQTKLLVDLGQTTQIELSGLFALHSIARLYAGGSLLDPESGWAGLRAAAEEATPALGDQGTGKSTIMRRFTSLMRNVCMVEEEQVVAMT